MLLNFTDTAREIALIEDGRSQYYGAAVLGVTRCSVQRAVERFRGTGNYARREGSGRKRSTTAQDDRFITMEVLQKRAPTAVMVRNHLQEVRAVAVSERTVRRRLQEYDLKARRPANGPQLTRQHRVDRLHFA